MSKPCRKNKGVTDCSVKPIMPYLRVTPTRTKLLREVSYWRYIAPKYMSGINTHVMTTSNLRLLRNALREIARAKEVSTRLGVVEAPVDELSAGVDW